MTSLHETQITEAGKRLAVINPDSPALKYAREWWAAGRLSRYSMEDFDVLNGLQQEIDRHYAKVKQEQQVCWSRRLKASCP
jgi:hypothetical protein